MDETSCAACSWAIQRVECHSAYVQEQFNQHQQQINQLQQLQNRFNQQQITQIQHEITQLQHQSTQLQQESTQLQHQSTQQQQQINQHELLLQKMQSNPVGQISRWIVKNMQTFLALSTRVLIAETLKTKTIDQGSANMLAGAIMLPTRILRSKCLRPFLKSKEKT